MIQTLNFNPIDDPKLRCTCRAVSCDHRMVKQWVLDNLQLMRNDIKRSMIVTSGGRCSSHPNEINKDLPGDHQLCEAVDIACDDIHFETKLKVLAGRYGATRVAGGAYCGFVHLSWTKPERRDVPTWGYGL